MHHELLQVQRVSGLTGQCTHCGHLIKEFMGRTIPHACDLMAAAERTRQSTAGLLAAAEAPIFEPAIMTRTRRTPGDELRAALAARDAEVKARKDRQARALAEAGTLTLWRVPADSPQLGLWGLLRTCAYSPVGAMLGLALLALCWLSGCA